MGEFADAGLEDLCQYEVEYGEGVRCKYCGLSYLQWEEARDERNRKRWVLMDGANIHHCSARPGPAALSEFEDLTKKRSARTLRKPRKKRPLKLRPIRSTYR